MSVLLQPGEVGLRRIRDSAQIHVVRDIGKLDLSGDWICRGTPRRILARFPVVLGQRPNGRDDGIGESRLMEVFKGDVRVFDGIVQQSRYSFILRLHREHDADGMKNVRLAGLVSLAGMGSGGDGQCTLECPHTVNYIGRTIGPSLFLDLRSILPSLHRLMGSYIRFNH
jgi:hypothetical protein